MNILDLSPEDFESSLKELGLGAEREQFLRDEYTKKNTISGQTLEAFQEATAVPEGRERAMIAPMTKPEGMSGLEAIRSGEAELAVPGFLTGAVEGAGQALTTGEKVTQGISVTEEELQQAAETGASLGLSGVATRIGKPLDRTVISSGGAAGSGKAFKPSMFSTGDIPLKPSGYSVAEFYSPVVETIRNAEFPSKGYKGKELLKLLRDKTPGVRKAELDAMDFTLDPERRYTQEELLDLAQKRSYRVSAEVVDNDIFQSQQRQDIRDPEVEYATLKVNAIPNSEEVPAFLPKMGYTHYDPETVAHTRVSVREGQGGSYLLIEELQSDLLQHGFVKPRGAISRDAAYDEVLDNLSEAITKGDNKELSDVYLGNKEFFDTYFKLSAESSRQTSLKQRGIEIPEAETQELESLLERTQSLYTQAQERGEVTDLFQRMYNTMDTAGFEEGPRIDRRTAPTGKSPLTENSDAVRLSLQAAMAKAADSDVKSLVIPNVERIVAADRARPGSKEYFEYVDPKSGFTRTYVKGVEKFIKQLQDQYGDAVKVEVVELPYTKQNYYYEGQEYALPTTGIKIDFSGIEGVDFRVSRFAEGGMVEDNQMRKLFQEGGMTDDGMQVEPVTGNEIPPGSMASEVRDDIPAQLSEGEYIVPADVVRFFGVKFFEDLRMQAKQGLTEMDKDGRIGGTPVDQNGIPVEEDEELSPEEEQMLREALGITGMAEGGFATRDPAFGEQGFDRTQFALSDPAGGVEARKYIDPTTGKTTTVQFMNGTPIGAIPAGYVPWTQELENQVKAAQKPTKPVPLTPVKTESGADRKDTGGQTTGGGTGGGAFNYDNWAKENYDAITKDPYQFGIDSLTDKSGDLTGKLVGGAGMVLGGPLGMAGMVGSRVLKGVNEVQDIAGAKVALLRMEKQGLKNTQEYANLEKLIGAAVDNLPGLEKLLVEQEIAGTGLKYEEALNRVKPETTAKEPTPTRTSPAPSVAKPSAAKPVQQTQLGFSPSTGKDSSDKLSFSPSTTGGKSATSSVTSTGAGSTPKQFSSSTTGGKSTPVASSKASDYSTGSKTAPSTGKTTSGGYSLGTPAKDSGVKKESIEQKVSRGGGFQKGGLVTRPKTKKK